DTEAEAARQFFTLLSNVHEQNAVQFTWVDGYSQDVDSPDFGMSIVNSAHFIAYFHPNASDPERRSELTYAVFNSHAILDALREKDRFDRLRTKIRGNQLDNPNRGKINPLLADHGIGPELVQYVLPDGDDAVAAVKAVQEEVLGKCPFGHGVELEGGGVKDEPTL
nr:YqcI/YcgG family protein [Candidatus Saccharibacteria bacterium]